MLLNQKRKKASLKKYSVKRNKPGKLYYYKTPGKAREFFCAGLTGTVEGLPRLGGNTDGLIAGRLQPGGEMLLGSGSAADSPK